MEQQTHKRRVHYKGTHPRTYQEKYKELNPEKYKEGRGTGSEGHFRICGGTGCQQDSRAK